MSTEQLAAKLEAKLEREPPDVTGAARHRQQCQMCSGWYSSTPHGDFPRSYTLVHEYADGLKLIDTGLWCAHCARAIYEAQQRRERESGPPVLEPAGPAADPAPRTSAPALARPKRSDVP